jgi:hypothetical protein
MRPGHRPGKIRAAAGQKGASAIAGTAVSKAVSKVKRRPGGESGGESGGDASGGSALDGSEGVNMTRRGAGSV